MDLNSTPKFAVGCRLHRTDAVMLIPEGALNLSGPTRDILLQVDGGRTVAGIVDALQVEYEGADRAEIEADVLGLLEQMQERGVIRS